jgi:hypothetical protein
MAMAGRFGVVNLNKQAALKAHSLTLGILGHFEL